MKKNKVIIIAAASAVILICGFFGAKFLKARSVTVDVTPVSVLNSGFFEDPLSMDGMVSDSDSQTIRLESTQIVSEVFVTEGQNVKKGDALMSFDISSQELTSKLKELEVLKAKNSLENAQADLHRLENTTPVPEPAPIPEPKPEPKKDEKPTKPEPGKQIQTGEAWNYLNADNVKKFHLVPGTVGEGEEEAKPGTITNPYRYLVTEDGMVYGSFFNLIGKELPDAYAVIEIRKENKKEGVLIASWTFTTNNLKKVKDDDSWYVISRTSEESPESPIETPEPEEIPEVPQQPEGMTRQELAKAITDKQIEIKNLDLNLRRATLALERLKSEMSDGVVYAKNDGVVSIVSNPASPPQNGEPFLRVDAGNGAFVKGNVSELMLDKVQPEQQIMATNFENGNTYTGKVISVDNFPAEQGYYYGSGNPNASHYGFTVQLDEATDLEPGRYIQLSPINNSSESEGIFLSNAYIRNDSKGSYVMKDDNGTLKKQYIKCGRIFFGEVTEVLEGVTMEDAIAFPYGAGNKEGSKTKFAEEFAEGMEG